MKRWPVIGLLGMVLAPAAQADLQFDPPPGVYRSGVPMAVTITPLNGSTGVNYVCSGRVEGCPVYPAEAAYAEGPVSLRLSPGSEERCVNAWDEHAADAGPRCYRVLPPDPFVIEGIYFTDQTGGRISMPASWTTTHVNIVWQTSVNADCSFAGVGPQNGAGTRQHYATVPVQPGYRQAGTIRCQLSQDPSVRAETGPVTIEIASPPAATLSISSFVLLDGWGQPAVMPLASDTRLVEARWNTDRAASCAIAGLAVPEGQNGLDHRLPIPVYAGYQREFMLRCETPDLTASAAYGPFSVQVSSETPPPPPEVSSHTVRIVVKFRPSSGAAFTGKAGYLHSANAAVDRLNARYAAQSGRRVYGALGDAYALQLSTSASAETVARAYAAEPSVEYAHPDYVMDVLDLPVPNDPYLQSAGSWGQPYDDLWGLKKIDAPRAWEISQGEGVLVAVVDTGVDYTHPDIADNVARRPGLDFTSCLQIGAYGGCDVEKPRGDDPMDRKGHGTHVAGTIAAIAGNGIGIAGVAPKAKILPIKALDDNGRGYSSDLAAAIAFAADSGARVINNSWGCVACGRNRIAEDAVAYAYSRQATVVFAAGNSNNDSGEGSPRNMTFAKPIVVGSTDENDQKSDYSSFGAIVDVAAPGGGSGDSCNGQFTAGNILSLRLMNPDPYAYSVCPTGTDHVGESPALLPDPSAPYARLRGTSMAAPHVSGVAALILAAHPDYNPDQVRGLIARSADGVGQIGFGPSVGRLNAYRALSAGLVPTAAIESPAARDSIDPAVGTVSIKGSAYGPSFDSYELAFADVSRPGVWTPIVENNRQPVQHGELARWDVGGLPYRRYTLRLRALSAEGLPVEALAEVWLEPPARQMTRAPSAPSGGLAVNQGRLIWQDRGTNNGSRLVASVPGASARALGPSNSYVLQSDVSADRVAFIDYRSGFRQLYVADLARQSEQALTGRDTNVDRTAISGDRIAFVAQRNGEYGLYLFDLALRQESRLTALPGPPDALRFDGDHLLYWLPAVDGRRSLVLFDLETRTERVMQQGVKGDAGLALQGDWAAWREYGAGPARSDVVAFNLVSGERRPISQSGAATGAPCLDGETVVWIDARNGFLSPALFAYRLDTAQERQLTSDSSIKSECSISAGQVVWLDDRDGTPQVFETTLQETPRRLSIFGLYYTNQAGVAVEMPAPADTTHINIGWRTDWPATCSLAGVGPQNGSGTMSHFATVTVAPGFDQDYEISCARVFATDVTARMRTPRIRTAQPPRAPSLERLSVAAVTVQEDPSESAAISVFGHGFSSSTVVYVNGQAETALPRSDSELVVTLTARWLARPQALHISLSPDAQAPALTLEVVPAPQQPLLDQWPATVTVDGTLLVQDQGFGTEFRWLFERTGDALTSRVAPQGAAFARGATGISLTTIGPRLNLADVALRAGSYRVQVVAVNQAGRESKPAVTSIVVESASMAAVNVFPSPWRQDLHAGSPITFANLEPGSEVRLFTLSGRWIVSIPESGGQARWQLTNDDGQAVASGLYLYLVRRPQGSLFKGKLVVVR